MGRSCACKFLFGIETLAEEKEKIEQALENKQELKTELNFYRKDGNSFKCLLDIVPIKNEKSQVVLILVSHKDIGEKDKSSDSEDKSSEDELNSSDEEMAEAYRRCQVRQGRSSTALPGTAGYNSQRRRSRAVLYHLSGQFDKQNRANRAKTKLQQFNKLGSISAKMPEYKVQEVKKSKFILVHYGIFKIGWDWLILLCTFYTAILVPYNAAFTRAEKKDQRDSIYSDVVVEILFMFDILFNFRTSFVNKSGQVVYQARLIAVNYIRGWFLLDLLAAIPFDFLYIFRIKSEAPVHLLKVARLLRLARLLQKIDRFSQYSALVLALLMSMFTLLAHWLACIWYAIGHVEFENNETGGWLYELSERLDLHHGITYLNFSDHNTTVVKPDVLMSYISALYFTCTSLTSVGFGNVSANTNSEKIFSICAMIIGALMHAVVFGNVTALIQRMYQRRANFHSKTKDLKDFFRAYDIPKPLKQRMQEYFQTMWSMNNGIETTEILKDFPEEMKGELGLHLHREVLNLSIFEEATQGCLKSIALHTRRSFCAPGEFLVHKGDAANYLYLLVSGSMEVLESDMVVAILGKGDLFGSHIDFDDPISVCNYDVRSLTYSELQCISIKGLVDVLLLYPDFAEKFAKDIHNDLTYNLRHTSDDSDEESKGSPKGGRLFTLPSISEDDEVSASDEESNKSDGPDDEDQESPTSLHPHCTSPLLPQQKHPQKLPNGDLGPIESITNSPNTRNWGMRRGGVPITRNSIKETRKMRLGCHQNEATLEKIIPHVQNLQNEIEGTKASVIKLEKKISKIGHDISAIDRNMRQILKHITNNSKVSPLEPIYPSTPITPYSADGHFNFDNTDSKENLRLDRDSLSQKSVYCSSNELLVQPLHSHGHRHSKDFTHDMPLLLNPHDAYARRHSDGPIKMSRNKLEGLISVAKSDLSLRKQFTSDEQVQDASESQYGNKSAESRDTLSELDVKSTACDNISEASSGDLMNSLEEIHSHNCFKPDRRRKSEIVTSLQGKIKPCDKTIRKSNTCENLRCIPTLRIESSDNVVTDILQFCQPPMEDKTIKSNKQDKPKNNIEKPKTFMSPKRSHSSYEMKLTHYSPAKSLLTNKSKSCETLLTDIRANTSNDIKLIPSELNPNYKNRLSGSENVFIEDENGLEDNSDLKPLFFDPISLASEVNNLSVPNSKEPSNLEQVKYDSGNVSLLDAVDGDIFSNLSEPLSAASEQLPNKGHEFNTRDGTRIRGNVTFLERNKSLYSDSIEVSPDSVTDITESFQTDSVRTDDETVVDIEKEPDVMKLLQTIEEGQLRSTEL